MISSKSWACALVPPSVLCQSQLASHKRPLYHFIVYICDTGRSAAPSSFVAPVSRRNQRLWLGHDMFAIPCSRHCFSFSLGFNRQNSWLWVIEYLLRIQPFKIFFDEIRYRKFIGAACHALPALRTVSGIFNALS